MTAEVALLNKHGVALAADSAVTFTSAEGQKIYNAGNKLFALSKWQPVGIMVYGNAEFMGTPWETIIKVYRQQLGRRAFKRIDDYFVDFKRFLGSDDSLFGDDVQEAHVAQHLALVFGGIRGGIDQKVKTLIETEGSVDDEKVRAIAAADIRDLHKNWAAIGFADGMDAEFENSISDRYAPTIRAEITDAFGSFDFPSDVDVLLVEVAAHTLTRNMFHAHNAGVVISGFGTTEHFPALRSMIVEARIGGRLRHQDQKNISIGLGTKQSMSAIVPFAQIDAVGLFVEGIDPEHSKLALSTVHSTLREFAKEILGLMSLDEADRQHAADALNDIGNRLFQEFTTKLTDARRSRYVNPLLDVVQVLPKDELAAVAEALVSLTSLRRKVSLDAETVGGPVDVAVISKGDGLVWIRRKHYFEPKLNPHFLANYFLEPTPPEELHDESQ